MRALRIVFLVLALALPAAAEQNVRGDPAAWQEVNAAFQRLAEVQSYRIRLTFSALPELSGVTEVVNPDRIHVLIQIGPSLITETVVVGQEVRTRAGNGPWQCQSPPAGMPGGEAFPDARMGSAEATAEKLGESVIDDIATQGYRMVLTTTVSGRVVTTRMRLYVRVEDGLPRRMELLTDAEDVLATMDYYDFNAPITIELPSCG